ncbi:MAG: cyclic nucleotide-binding domain-containing protein, partial [Elusimicrobiota bacterium]
MSSSKKTIVGPKELNWLAAALKLDSILSDNPALEALLMSFPALSLETWPAGEAVIREGDAGDDFFVVYRGRLSVLRKGDSPAARRVGRLGPGDFFGEVGLLMKSCRSATVRTEAECRLFRFPAVEFRGLLRRNKMLDRWVKRVACKRLIKLFKGE